jgi:outer membrane receptor protein involved in Fe transport
MVRALCLLAIALLLTTPPPAHGQPQARVAGQVIDGVTDEPVTDARVESGRDAVATDADGRFSVNLSETDTTLRVQTPNYLETVVPVDGAELLIRLFPRTFAETVEVVSQADAQERPSSTAVTPAEVFRAPGSIDNVFRTLDTLPGVASTDDFGSRLAVRGGTPDQNLTVMDGIEVHNPYRLFGIASAFNPETVEHFQLSAGGFGAAYGDRLS